MRSYEALAGCYDQFTTDVNYSTWADYLERHFQKAELPGRRILDLACGTGSMTAELAARGYEVIGVDRSFEMLAQAEEKNRDRHPIPPVFFCQPMERLALPQKADGCVCCLDSVNYVTSPKKLEQAFRRVFECLNPGGVFIFDINTPAKLRGLDGQIFLDETEDAYCVWRAEYAPRRKICTYFMDLFLRRGDHWLREEELHEEYAYEPQELTEFLEAAGFVSVRQYGDLKLRAPVSEEQRIFFVARKDT